MNGSQVATMFALSMFMFIIGLWGGRELARQEITFRDARIGMRNCVQIDGNLFCQETR